MKTITITLTDEEIQGLKLCLHWGKGRLGLYGQNNKIWNDVDIKATKAYGKVMDAIEVDRNSTRQPPIARITYLHREVSAAHEGASIPSNTS